MSGQDNQLQTKTDENETNQEDWKNSQTKQLFMVLLLSDSDAIAQAKMDYELIAKKYSEHRACLVTSLYGVGIESPEIKNCFFQLFKIASASSNYLQIKQKEEIESHDFEQRIFFILKNILQESRKVIVDLDIDGTQLKALAETRKNTSFDQVRLLCQTSLFDFNPESHIKFTFGNRSYSFDNSQDKNDEEQANLDESANIITQMAIDRPQEETL